MARTMRAIAIKGGKGPADALFVDTIPVPAPASNQALVKVKAFGLNRMDLLQREGQYPVPPQAPSTLGVEFSGTIESFGDYAGKDFAVGDNVFGLAYGGAYAEYIAVSVSMLVHKPAELSWEETAGIPEAIITLPAAVSIITNSHGVDVDNSDASDVFISIAGIQLSKADNASDIYVTAGSQEKIDFCVDKLGATAGYNYRTQDWASEIQKATEGRGVDVVIDFVGATHFQGNLNVAARDGRIVQLGQMSGSTLPAGVDISSFIRKRLRFEGSTLRSRDEQYQKKLRDLLVEHALPKFKDGSFKIFIEKTFPFEQVAEAHKLLESNR
ncbi:quinone oxidoreductase [Paecilomyces variotii No. 5]|uniref:Quinone oxidoreductase n=1 Tax=Byssochlamys spectabilis (strain No. 5 / NBRC 109023) TaxID=1356009 RepID=V5I4N2_BYSSN|nr:quinone oxidoreductase [Paecilomyces variotii No. 5]